MSAADAEPAPPVAVGDVVDGKYRVDRLLGRGAMGVVVAATHLQLEQPVAIKFLMIAGEGVPFERFLREARATARLKGLHVCRVLDVTAREGEVPFIVMEYLDGQDLDQVLRARGPLPIAEAVDYVLQACEGLAEAHAAGIVHRDLKPANLFLASAPDGSPAIKVVDFGLVKDLSTAGDSAAAPQLTEVGGMLGSPLYMSPEQVASPKDVDVRTDIWSLGVVLFELLTGRAAFNATTLNELIVQIGYRPPSTPSQLRPELGGPVEAIILRCLEKLRDERFATVAHLAAELAPLASEEVRPCAARAARLLGIGEALTPTLHGAAASPGGAAQPEASSQADSSDVGSTIPLRDEAPAAVQTVETKPAYDKGATLPMDEPPAGLPAEPPPPALAPGLPPAEAQTLVSATPTRRGPALLWLALGAVLLLAAIVAAALWLRSDGDEEREPPAAPSATGPSRPCDHAEDSRIDLGGAEATGCRAYLTGRRLCLRCEAREWGNLEEVHLPERPAGSHLDIKAEAALVELPLTPGAELRLELRWKDVARWAVLRLPGGSARPDHIGVVEPVLVPIFYSLNRGEGYPDCGITEPQLLIDGCERREGLAWLAAELDRLRAAGAARLATLPAGLSLRAETDPEGHPFIAVRSPGDPRVTHQLVFPPQMLEIVPTTGGEPVVLRLDVEKQWWLERKGEDGRMRFDRLR